MYDEKKNERVEVPRWPEIKVVLEVPSGLIVDTHLTGDMLAEFEKYPPAPPTGIPYIRPFGYFKIEGEYNEENPPILKVLYTQTAWDASIAAGGGGQKPRIFIRKYNGEWVGDWKEIKKTTPITEGIYIGLLVEIPNLPDPAIGGC